MIGRVLGKIKGPVALALIGILVILAAVSYRLIDRELTRRAEAPLNVVASRGGFDTFVDLEGNQISLDEYRGGSVAIVTWATWCPSCHDQLRVAAQVAEKEGVAVLALNRMEPRATIDDYLNHYGAVDGLRYIIDTKDLFHSTTEGFAVPEFFLFDDRGEIRVHTRGEQTAEELQVAIQSSRDK